MTNGSTNPLEARLEEAMALARARGDLLATMSHELRTPLNGVMGMSTLLAGTNLDPEQRELLETIQSAGKSLLQIVNDVLDLSKMEAGKLELESHPFDLEIVVEEVTGLLAEKAQGKGVELCTRIPRGVPRWLLGDGQRLRQVLINLVGNAIKFTETGHVCLSVSREGTSGVELRFEVEDTGVGLTPEQQSRLFQPYSQAEASTARKFGGTGLGLSICKQLCELMGGNIGVESEHGRGSTFWFTIEASMDVEGTRRGRSLASKPSDHEVLLIAEPGLARDLLLEELTSLVRDVRVIDTPEQGRRVLCKRSFPHVLLSQPGESAQTLETVRALRRVAPDAQLSCLADLATRRRAMEFREHGCPLLSLPFSRRALRKRFGSTPQRARRAPVSAQRSLGLKVLTVDDNFVNRRVLQRFLKKLGCECLEACDGVQAVEALKAQSVDLVFMDCHMPNMDGWEATRAIREREADGPRTPIVALTGDVSDEDRERCRQAGMDGFLGKPLRFHELEAAVEAWAQSAKAA